MDRLLGARAFKRVRNALALVCLGALLISPFSSNDQVSGNGGSRFQITQSLIAAGRCAEAQVEAENLLATLGGAQAEPSTDVEQAIDLLVEALLCNGRGAEATTRALAEQVIRTKEARVGPTDLTLASSRRNLGDVLIQFGEYQLAGPQYEHALRIRETVLGQNHPDVADDLDHLARGLTLVEKYDEALAASNRALAIKQRTLDSSDIRIARTLEVRGLLLQRKGDYAGARPDLERALTLRELADPTHPEAAGTLSLLGEQLRLEGDLVQAKQVSARALAIAEKALRPDHPDIASYLRILAIPIADLGDLAGARVLRERALAIVEKSLGSDHPAVAVQLNDLGLSLVLLGEHSAARPLYERALRIYERRFGPDYIGVTTEVFNLAIVSASLGDYREARRLFNRAITTWERDIGPDYSYVALAHSALAEMLSDQGLDAEARVSYERAIAVQERTLGKNHRDVARTLALLSNTLARLGEVQQASELCTRALEILERLDERETRRAAYVLTVRGTVLADQGDDVGARASYDRALTVLRRIVGSSHPDVAEVQIPLAAAYADMGQTSKALGNALEAEAIGRDHLRLMLRNLPERQGLGYAAKRAEGLDFALSLASASLAGDEDARVLDSLIRSRGLVLDEMARRRHASVDATRPDLAPLWATLVSAQQRYANLVIRSVDEQHPERYPVLLEDARREKEDAERAFANKSAAFGNDLSRADMGLDEVHAAIPANSALVAFARYDRTPIASATAVTSRTASGSKPVVPRTPVPSYIAFVLRDGQTQPWVVPLGRADTLDTLIADWRREMVADITRPAGAPPSDPSFRSLSTTLRRKIWDPVAEHLGDATRVFVVPDGALNLVPFAALPSGRNRYLLEDGPVIHYLSAERDLVTGEQPTEPRGRGLLAIGGPEFADGSSFAALTRPKPLSDAGASKAASPTTAAASAMPSLPATFLRGTESGCVSFQSMQFEALPAARREAEAVAELWRRLESDTTANAVQLLIGPDATEQTFKRLGLGRRVLHLATHGFFLGDDCVSEPEGTRAVGGLTSASKAAAVKRASQPQARARVEPSENVLVRSGLALAGADRRAAAGPAEDDGILTAEEVAALNLEGVEWAVLSACDTGLGEIRAGEGVLGLRRAFQVAGARTVIMSLWSVEDKATREWMQALYQGRLQQHLGTADAMRQAGLSVLSGRRAKGQNTHPFYWAGFVAAGDWR